MNEAHDPREQHRSNAMSRRTKEVTGDARVAVLEAELRRMKDRLDTEMERIQSLRDRVSIVEEENVKLVRRLASVEQLGRPV